MTDPPVGGAPPSRLPGASPAAEPERDLSPGEPDILGSSRAGSQAVRGAALRVTGYFVTVLAGAASASLLLRHLGTVDTGRYMTIASLVAIIAGVSDLGLTAVGLREASSRSQAERDAVLRALLGLRILLTVAGVALMTAIAAVSYPTVFVIGVPIAGFGLLLQTVQDNYGVLLQVSLRMGWVTVLDLVRGVGSALITAALALAGAGVLAFVAITVPIGLATVVLSAALIRGERSLAPSFDPARWKSLVRHVLPYSVAVAASVVYFQMGQVMTSALASGQELGYFGASFRVIQVLTLLPGLAVGTAFPIFARAASENHRRLGYALERVFEVAIILAAWTALSVAALAGLAMSLIGGHEFAPAATVLAIQGIALAGTFVGAVWSYGLLSLGLYRRILFANVSLLILSVGVMAVLIPSYGARGAAVGTAVGEVLAATLDAYLLLRDRPQLRPRLRVLPRVALASAVAAIPLFFAGVPAIARFALSTALYGAILAATKAFPPELGDLIPERLRRRFRAT
jgi:O-antigen/teichoic acid export membrane protein